MIEIRRYFFIWLLFAMSGVYAAPLMGTTMLLYGESNATSVLLGQWDIRKIHDPNYNLAIKRSTLAEIVKQMPGFQAILDLALAESGSFSIYNANSSVEQWRNNNIKVLDTFYKTKSIEATGTESGSSNESRGIVNSKNLQHKFIMLGWVENIRESEMRTQVSGTNKTVLLYSLDISCEYRMINANNNQVVAKFSAVGHGGVARILATPTIPVDYNVTQVVNDMFYSLAQNVRHVLQLRENEYIKRRIDAAKITIESAAKAK